MLQEVPHVPQSITGIKTVQTITNYCNQIVLYQAIITYESQNVTILDSKASKTVSGSRDSTATLTVLGKGNKTKSPSLTHILVCLFFFSLGFTPCKAEYPLQGTELQEKAVQKD